VRSVAAGFCRSLQTARQLSRRQWLGITISLPWARRRRPDHHGHRGPVSGQMLKHYSHIRMEAKREALNAVWKKQEESEQSKQASEANRAQDCSPQSTDAQKTEGGSLQESLQLGVPTAAKRRRAARMLLKRLAPQVGLEPTTLRLTAGCSTIELLRNSSRRGFHRAKSALGCQTAPGLLWGAVGLPFREAWRFDCVPPCLFPRPCLGVHSLFTRWRSSPRWNPRRRC
jgi:hypothetical protein